MAPLTDEKHRLREVKSLDKSHTATKLQSCNLKVWDKNLMMSPARILSTLGPKLLGL